MLQMSFTKSRLTDVNRQQVFGKSKANGSERDIFRVILFPKSTTSRNKTVTRLSHQKILCR